MTKIITPAEFLRAHKLDKKIFISAMFYKGITISTQQIRTLNLVYFLIKRKIIPKPESIDKRRKILIVGGGISGVTAAIAFKKKGYDVILIEEKSLLLHLQHGCSTRMIHPNLHLWPSLDADRPFTELPFANWDVASAATGEKRIYSEYETTRSEKGGTILPIYHVKDIRVDTSSNRIRLRKNESGPWKQISFSVLLIATGFGLEKYVGKGEKTKSYWRNEDLSQLRIGQQVSNFLVSGVGDGGVSDIFRLVLIGFDPVEWSRNFEAIEKGNVKLIDRLRALEKANRSKETFNYYTHFEKIYEDYENSIIRLVNGYKRRDVDELVLNGREKKFQQILKKGNLNFFNAWMIFVLHKMELFKYWSGDFPRDCGDFIFNNPEIKKEYFTIVRHGTDRNKDLFKKLNPRFEGSSLKLAGKQEQKVYNDFSTQIHWELEFWRKPPENISKKFFLSKDLRNFCLIYLKTLEGILNNYIRTNFKGRVDYRITIHRLVMVSDKAYFQQASDYVGTRIDGEVGRAFPINEGIVGLAMRSNSCYSFVRSSNYWHLFNYSRIFARKLPQEVDGFFAVPIVSDDSSVAPLCIYVDTKDERLVRDSGFRKLIYSSLSFFVPKIEEFNFEKRKIPQDIIDKSTRKMDSILLRVVPGIKVHNDEVKDSGLVKMSSNKLIDLYVS